MLAVFAQNFALSGMVYCIAVLTGNLSQAQILLNMVVLLSMVRSSACNAIIAICMHEEV